MSRYDEHKVQIKSIIFQDCLHVFFALGMVKAVPGTQADRRDPRAELTQDPTPGDRREKETKQLVTIRIRTSGVAGSQLKLDSDES